jgi:transcriptional regulator with XRE-family HTH domain
MSTQPINSHIPEWDMADRMRKTLRDSGLSVQAIADEFGVSRNTIGSWINGHIVPNPPAIRLWALRFGVPLEWLVDGTTPPEPDGPDGGVPAPTPVKKGRKKLPHLDSNQKPFDIRLAS